MNEQLIVSILTLLNDKPLSVLGVLGEMMMTAWNTSVPDDIIDTNLTGKEMATRIIHANPFVKSNFFSQMEFKTPDSETVSTNEIELAKILEESDKNNGVRPALAKLFGYISAGFSVAIGVALTYRWIFHGEAPDWDILLIAMYLPMHVTLSYFHIRSSDKQLRAAIVSQGQISPKSSKMDLLNSLLKGK